MSLEGLSKQGRLRKLDAGAEELRNLLAMADQALQNAGVAGLTPDGKYLFAYGAALSLAAVVVREAGYKARGQAHHETLFEALRALVPGEAETAAYFDRCREKRNTIAYKQPFQATAEQAEELMARASAFREVVKKRLAGSRPDVLSGPER